MWILTSYLQHPQGESPLVLVLEVHLLEFERQLTLALVGELELQPLMLCAYDRQVLHREV